jgi:hypothetical protein
MKERLEGREERMVCTLFFGQPAVGDSKKWCCSVLYPHTLMGGLNESDNSWKKGTNSRDQSAAMGGLSHNAYGKEKMGTRLLLKFSRERTVRWRRCKIQ